MQLVLPGLLHPLTHKRLVVVEQEVVQPQAKDPQLGPIQISYWQVPLGSTVYLAVLSTVGMVVGDKQVVVVLQLQVKPAQLILEQEVVVVLVQQEQVMQAEPAQVAESSSLSFEIILLTGDLAVKVLPLMQEYIIAALEYAHRETNVEALAKRMLNNEIQLWAVYDKGQKCAIGAATTILQRYDQCHALRIITLSGKQFSAWKQPLLNRLEQFAAEHGATRVEASGRRGWAKVLQPLGFEPAYVTYVKELE